MLYFFALGPMLNSFWMSTESFTTCWVPMPVVEHHARLDGQRALEESAVVADPRAVVDVLRRGIERFAGVQSVLSVGNGDVFADRDVAQGLQVFAQIEVVLEFHAPLGQHEVDLCTARFFPVVVYAAAALRGEEEPGLDVEVEEGVESPARIGVYQQVVRDVLVELRTCEMEHREGITEVEAPLERVASRRDDAEHFARLLGIHAFPVDRHFYIGILALGGFIMPEETRQAVVVERRRVAEERPRIIAQQLLAVEDTGVGLYVLAVELVIYQRFHVAQERFAGAVVLPEVLQEVYAEDQPVFLHPFHADAGCEAGAEERLRFVEIVVGVFPVVEAGREVGADDQILRAEASSRGKGGER